MNKEKRVYYRRKVYILYTYLQLKPIECTPTQRAVSSRNVINYRISNANALTVVVLKVDIVTL